MAVFCETQKIQKMEQIGGKVCAPNLLGCPGPGYTHPVKISDINNVQGSDINPFISSFPMIKVICKSH